MDYVMQYPTEPSVPHWITDADGYVWHHKEPHVWESVDSGYTMEWEELMDKYGPLSDTAFPVMGENA